MSVLLEMSTMYGDARLLGRPQGIVALRPAVVGIANHECAPDAKAREEVQPFYVTPSSNTAGGERIERLKSARQLCSAIMRAVWAGARSSNSWAAKSNDTARRFEEMHQ
jgi:hypothetical protein